MDMPENLSSNLEEHKYLKRFKKSWEKRFRHTRMNELYQGVELANYLIALQRESEAKELLHFITDPIEFSGNYNIWSPAGAGIALLASLLRKEKSSDYERVISKIEENGYYNPKRRKAYYTETLLEHESLLKEAMHDTQKWGCHSLSGQLMRLTYHTETAYRGFEDTDTFDIPLLEKLIEETYQKLHIKLD